MAEIKPTTFRLPSKYLVFLEMLAQENESDRTKELLRILEQAIAQHLSQSRSKGDRPQRPSSSRR